MHNRAQLDEEAEKYNDHCRRLCNKFIARKVIDMEQNIWWDGELDQQRRVNRERREWRTEKRDNEREEKREKYKHSKCIYNKLIKRKKMEYVKKWSRDIIENKPWHKARKLLQGGNNIINNLRLEREDGTFIEEEDEKNEHLLTKYFPTDSPENDTEEQKELRKTRNRYTKEKGVAHTKRAGKHNRKSEKKRQQAKTEYQMKQCTR